MVVCCRNNIPPTPPNAPLAHNALWLSTRPAFGLPSYPTVMFHIAVNVSIGSCVWRMNSDTPQGWVDKTPMLSEVLRKEGENKNICLVVD